MCLFQTSGSDAIGCWSQLVEERTQAGRMRRMVPQLPCKRTPMSCLGALLVSDGNLKAGKGYVAGILEITLTVIKPVIFITDPTFPGKPAALVWGLDMTHVLLHIMKPMITLLQPTFVVPCFWLFPMIAHTPNHFFIPLLLSNATQGRLSLPALSELSDDAKQRSVEEVRPTMSLWTVGMICDRKRVINVAGRGITKARRSRRSACLCTLSSRTNAWNAY